MAEGTGRIDLLELAQLGSGGQDDRLSFRLVLRIFWRCIPLLKSVKRHLALFVAAVLMLAPLGLAAGLLLFDLFWTRILHAEPLTAFQAQLLGLDPDISVHVETLSAEVRQTIRNRLTVEVLLGALVFAPIVAALFYYTVWILQRVNQNLREELAERLQRLSLRFHAESRIGDAVYRLYQDSAMVTDLIRTLFLEPLWHFGVFAFATAAVAVVFRPAMALVLLAIWPPTLLLGAWFSRRLRTGFRGAREANSALTSRIVETLAGIRVIKAYGAEAREQERFEEASRRAFERAHGARFLFALFGVMMFWISGALLLTLTGWAALLASEQGEIVASRIGALAALGITAWNLGAFNLFKERSGDGTQSIELLYRVWGRAQDMAIGLDRVFELLDLEPEVEDAPDAVPFPNLVEGIRFEGVRFGYREDSPVLRDVSLSARPGTVTAIVGPTGSGKSTLMALLLRLFDPDAGQIRIDGVDLRRIRLADLRRSISVALQENLLFGATVRENIRYAVPLASEDEVQAAARVACADGFIEALPEGYDTRLGERGTKLSTGQRQRLSIARAVLKDTPVLILDEPTASLDAETELQLLERLEAWGRDRVIFLVTHRLSTIRRADQIVVLREGRIAECGSHPELLRAGGLYRRLVHDEQPSPSTALTGGS